MRPSQGFLEGLKLSLDPATAELAQKIYERCRTAINDTVGLQPAQEAEEPLRLWKACILFIARGLRSPASGRRPTVSDISKAFDLSLADFLKELPVAVKRAEPNLALLFGDSPPLERRLRLRELQSVYVYSTVLAKKCRDLFHAHFDLPVGGGGASEPSAFGLTWLLYICAKARLLPPFSDLVSSFNLLVAVIGFAHAHIPARLRAGECLAASAPAPGAAERHGGGADALAWLATTNKVSEAELRPLAARLDALVAELLPGLAGEGGSGSSGAAGVTDAAAEAGPGAGEGGEAPSASGNRFAGLFVDPASVAAACEALNNAYEAVRAC